MLYSGSFITRGSGAVGEVVASHNRGGQYLRQRVAGTDPNTSAQQTVRGYMATASSRYSTILTATQIEAWRYYAASSPRVNALGADFWLTAQQQYIRTNVIRQILGLSLLDAAPQMPGYPPLPIISAVDVTLTGSPGPVDVTVDFDEAPESGHYAVWVGPSRTAAVNWFRGPWRYLGKTATDQLSATSPTSDYGSGSRLWIYARAVAADGAVSGKSQSGPHAGHN